MKNTAVTYTWLSPDGTKSRRDMSEPYAYSVIGTRVSMGFPACTRFYRDRENTPRSVTFFVDDGGNVWAIYDFNN